MSKLVAYFSPTGTTAGKAQALAEITGADLYEIVPAEKYSRHDLDWMSHESRATLEMRDWSTKPQLAETEHDFSEYDMVYLGFPIWWYTAPTIMHTFLDTFDFTDKKIMLFATSGGSRIDRAIKDLTKLYPNLDIIGGKLLNGEVTEDII